MSSKILKYQNYKQVIEGKFLKLSLTWKGSTEQRSMLREHWGMEYGK